MQSRLLFALPLLLLGACDGTVSVSLSTGPQSFEASLDGYMLPPELNDGSGVFPSVPCSGMCPSTSSASFSCVSSVCDPDAVELETAVGDVVDLNEMLSEASEILRVVDAVEIVEIRYDVEENTLNHPTSDVVVYWGPESATGVDPAMGVTRLGTVPAIAAGTTGPGTVIIDEAGAAAFSDRLVDVGRLRFFASTELDADPGDAIPQGGIRVTVTATVRAVGRLID